MCFSPVNLFLRVKLKSSATRQKKYWLMSPTCNKWKHQWPFAVIFTVNSTICVSCSRLAVNHPIQTTCSWVITSIEATTVSRLSRFSSHWKFASRIESQFWEVTTRADKSLKFTDSMTSAWGSTVTLTFGNNSLSYSITCHWLLLSKTKCSAFTVVSRPVSTLWTRFDSSIESRRLLMRGLSVIFFGLILMIDAVGVLVLEALAIASVRISQSSSITQITWPGLRVLISSSWTGTTGPMRGTSLRCSPHPITATDAETRLQLWKLTSSWSIISSSSTRLLAKPRSLTSVCAHLITSSEG